MANTYTQIYLQWFSPCRPTTNVISSNPWNKQAAPPGLE
jgi:hypothetical protein